MSKEAGGAGEVAKVTGLTFPSDLRIEIDGYTHIKVVTVAE